MTPFLKAIRQLETGGKPVVAALNGTALGGGSNWRSPAIGGSRPIGRPRGSVCRK